MTLVKICGLKDPETAIVALDAGADLLGFVFAASRRNVDPETARHTIRECRRRCDRKWMAVGVFADQPLELVRDVAEFCELDTVQLSGNESVAYCRALSGPLMKAFHVAPLDAGPADDADESVRSLHTLMAAKERNVRILLDTGSPRQWGGTGKAFDWERIGYIARSCMVAGGLTPANVGMAIEKIRPWGVDVSSGVEVEGKKDPWLIKRFISEVRRHDVDVI